MPPGPAPSLNSQVARCACALVCNPLRLLQPAPSRLGFAFQIRISGKKEGFGNWDSRVEKQKRK